MESLKIYFNPKDQINAKEEFDFFNSNKLLKIHTILTPIEGLELYDIRIKDRFKEDYTFLNNDEIFTRIRRGNCIVKYRIGQNEEFKVGRKGLVKFFDYL